MGKLKGDDDYEYGYDHLYEEEEPADVEEDAERLADDDEQGEAELEIDQDDYGDDEPDDTGGMEGVLVTERIMREVNTKPPDPDISEGTPGMLVRETKAEALRRFEEAAQSLEDFKDVILHGTSSTKTGSVGNDIMRYREKKGLWNMGGTAMV